ncbi:sensor histidine kinase [Paenibacillus gansuensis]|uniref:histidine kinase n=1 Tax=Paenibacillus gansuensis TaxID=306542 RepID=A0ABW5PJL5_9BACL
MKLFFREHLLLICWSIGQSLLVLFIYTLDGHDRLPTALYAFFITQFLFACYLVLRYVSHRHFYRRLSHPLDSLQNSVQSHEAAPLPAALSELLEAQYRKYLEEQQAWQRKQRERSTFVDHWVHQLKTPLSVIQMTAQEDDDDERMSSISEEAERMRSSVEMLLYQARLETFEQDFSVEKVYLSEVVIDAVHEQKGLFIRSHVYPEVKVDDKLQVQTDAKWLRFLVLQLLSNAIKYSAGYGSRVTVTAYSKENMIVLEVTDQGVGIPKADIRRVFEPFYTGENGRKFKESTGMGLYLVKEVCDKLGHAVEIESQAGAGTTVRLYFQNNLTTL